MNDFFLASDRNIQLELNHNKIIVNQLKMHNFDQWSGHAQAIKDFLKTHPDDIPKLLQEKTVSTLAFAACSINCDVKELEQIITEERNRSFELIVAAIKVNDAFFSEPDAKHDNSVDPRKKSTWFDVFQLLISNGHTHESVMQMTYGQFRFYIAAAQRTEKAKLRSLAGIMRNANHANNKAFTDLIKSLEK